MRIQVKYYYAYYFLPTFFLPLLPVTGCIRDVKWICKRVQGDPYDRLTAGKLRFAGHIAIILPHTIAHIVRPSARSGSVRQ
jgi:hypothetical protein